jgi:hypothetical protein
MGRSLQSPARSLTTPSEPTTTLCPRWPSEWSAVPTVARGLGQIHVGHRVFRHSRLMRQPGRMQSHQVMKVGNGARRPMRRTYRALEIRTPLVERASMQHERPCAFEARVGDFDQGRWSIGSSLTDQIADRLTDLRRVGVGDHVRLRRGVDDKCCSSSSRPRRRFWAGADPS